MFTPLAYLSIICTCTQVLLATPLLTNDSTNMESSVTLIQPLANVTNPASRLSAVNIPTDFRYQTLKQGPPSYTMEAVLYNTILALAKIAKDDFNGVMPPLDYRSKRYPEPRISILPPQGRSDLDRRFAIWGLIRAVLQMSWTWSYQRRQGRLTWRGVDVGTLQFGVWGATEQSPANWISPIKSSPTNSSVDDLEDRAHIVVVDGGDKVVRADELLYSIVGALSVAAVPSADDEVSSPWYFQWEDEMCSFVATRWDPPETTLPFTFRYLIDSLGAMTEWTASVDSYQNFEYWIEVGEREDRLAGVQFYAPKNPAPPEDGVSFPGVKSGLNGSIISA